jgi:aminomethyltransferase
MKDELLRRTPLQDLHRALKARMVPFAGWEMPVQYAGILEEARAVRTGVGLFDISHMGRVDLTGPGALALLQRLTTNDAASLSPGQAQYSLLTNPQGGIIDDIIVYRAAETEYRVVTNAGNTAKDLTWIRDHAGGDVAVEDWTERTAMIAVQGPLAPALVANLADQDVSGMPRFSFQRGTLGGVPAAFCRTGYTGEDGFEVIMQAGAASDLWRKLQAAGGAPCGLGARDVLRIEAGYPLYGHEIDETTTPVEAALMWVVRLEKGDFIGRKAILAVKEVGAGRKLVGIILRDRIIPRQGYTLYIGEEAIGTVTSGAFSPTTGHSIGMAYIRDPFHRPGTQVEVQIRAHRYPATVVPRKNLLGRA